MFEKILLATDFSPGAEKLMSCLEELKRVGARELTLVWAVDLHAGGGYSNTLQRHHLEKLEQKKEELEQSGFVVDYEAPIGFPAAEIVNVARERNCDLIVIGSRGKNVVRDIFLGSTVSDVIRSTTVPTLIERLELARHLDEDSLQLVCSRKLKSILFPTDFSDAAEEATRVVTELAAYAEKLVVVSVIDEGETEEDVAKLQDVVQGRIEALGSECTTACANVQVRVEEGIASKAINRIAEEEDSTLIVMGTRGKGRLPGIKLGSTVEAVARQARRPVLLVPPKKA